MERLILAPSIDRLLSTRRGAGWPTDKQITQMESVCRRRTDRCGLSRFGGLAAMMNNSPVGGSSRSPATFAHDFLRQTTIFRDFVRSIVAVKGETRLSGQLVFALAGSGGCQKSHFTSAGGIQSSPIAPDTSASDRRDRVLNKNSRMRDVLRRCPDASCSTARERRSAAPGLSPQVWRWKVMSRANFARMAVASK